MWKFNVLVSLLLFYITTVNCEYVFPPAIALYPKKTLMASDSNMTEWKPLNFKVDVASLKHHNILEYCKKSFPDLEIKNYFQSKDQVIIKNWCVQGKNVNCKGHQHKVFPYFCVDKNFEGLQITAQKGCSMHIKGKKSKDNHKEKCYDQKDWYSVGLAACKETNSNLEDHTVMKPCKKPGYFEAFKFVCCPNAIEKVVTKSEQVDDENADKCTLPPVVGVCRASMYRWHFDDKEKRCKVFLYGGCGGNKNNFATEEECKSQCRCHFDKETGTCRGFFMKWHYNKATGNCQEFVYGGCSGNLNRFESEQFCMSNCSAVQATNKQEDTTNVETEDFEVTISETEKDYNVVVDDIFDQSYMSKIYLEELEDVNINYKKARLVETENFEKLYKHSIADNVSHMRLVTNLHDIERSYFSKYENLLNRFRTETFDSFLDKSSSASDLTNEEILESLMAYVETEKYEQQYYLEHHKILLDDFNKHANIATAKDTNVVISSLQENITGLQNRLRKNLKSVDGRIKEEFSGEIENILNDFKPIKLEVVTYQVNDNIESSADSFDDTENEEEFDDQSQEFDVPNTSGSRTYEDDTSSEVTALKSTSWWLFWGGLFVTVLIAVLATKMVFQGKKDKKVKDKKVTKITQIFTPEEKQLLQMQQDGFENPTYKFFEKHQKA